MVQQKTAKVTAPKTRRRIETDMPPEAQVTPEAPKQEVMSKNDFFAAVHANAQVKPVAASGNGSKMKVLTPELPLRKIVDELVDWKKKMKEAEAEKDSREAKIINYVLPIQDEEGFKSQGREYQKSYRVQGVNETVTFVSSDKFSNVKSEDVEPLKEVLGARFSEFVTEKPGVSLKPEIFTNVELQRELMDRLGKENFSKFFNTTISYIPTDALDKKIFELPRKVVEQLRVFLKKAKPSIK